MIIRTIISLLSNTSETVSWELAQGYTNWFKWNLKFEDSPQCLDVCVTQDATHVCIDVKSEQITACFYINKDLEKLIVCGLQPFCKRVVNTVLALLHTVTRRNACVIPDSIMQVCSRLPRDEHCDMWVINRAPHDFSICISETTMQSYTVTLTNTAAIKIEIKVSKEKS